MSIGFCFFGVFLGMSVTFGLFLCFRIRILVGINPAPTVEFWNSGILELGWAHVAFGRRPWTVYRTSGTSGNLDLAPCGQAYLWRPSIFQIHPTTRFEFKSLFLTIRRTAFPAKKISRSYL